ncbi:N-acetylglucosamine-6-phosphate deacetylase [Alloacidobacterium dinghuense]|uniref:N-acetylglucosamine-6-phosphate deacetylase n=1 Tax=Alloacidobacterium dinghuense TaxID=2763107 RepID=A0A7G8BC27_9BACT|nr:N-acetylglucosamine-6-phosphate deacetylase [Alloacidobacterium dinghuense]QNI30097.1 N-acetylglucosamine-6-phosphate deacetylase [Alloacidobacterium dinghuense]
MRRVITAEKLLTPDKTFSRPVVVIEDGAISSITSRADGAVAAGEVRDYPGTTLVPAYLDVHFHGSGGADVMDGSRESLTTIGRFLARYGVGSYLATTISAPVDTTLRSLRGLAKLIGSEIEGARPLGIHIEGPFISHAKRGAHAERDLQLPTLSLFNRMWEAAEGHIRLMTIAPELPGADEVMARGKELGVRISLGHSNAGTEDTLRGIRAGATSATHTFNAMRRFDHREPGMLGVVLDRPELFAEIISDGLHVHPTVVRMFWKEKGSERAILVTDAMSATGMPDGNYRLGELEVRVKDGKCIIGEDTLAGSTLTMDRAVRNFAEFTGADIGTAATLATRNPARMIGLDSQVGALEVGRAADLIVLSPKGEVIETILRGQPVAAA